MNAHDIIWWTRISDKNSDVIFTAMNAHEILNYDGLKFLTSIRVWPLQQWMLMKLSDKLFHFDMLWFSKRRPTRSRHDDLKFSNLQCPRKIVCQSLNRNLWYHLILLKLEKWCLLIASEPEPMPNTLRKLTIEKMSFNWWNLLWSCYALDLVKFPNRH